jgi:hypothetical protein
VESFEPFLKIGTTLAFFKDLGYTPDATQFVINALIMGAIT